MKNTRTLAAIAALSVAVLPLCAQPVAVGLTRIGAAAAVTGRVLATAPGESVGRIVQGGKPLFLHDRVKTDSQGRLQVLLLDQTVFTLGPNSDMVLDEFVYDPATNVGKMTANVFRGAFRFVSGRIARMTPQNIRIKLAVGTIGIRGTTAVVETSPESGSYVANVSLGEGSDTGETPGVVTLENGGHTEEVPAGYETTASGDAPPTGAAPASDAKVNGLNDSIEGAGGQSAQGGPSGDLPADQGSASQNSGASTAEGGSSGADTGGLQGLTQTINQTAGDTAAQDSGDIAVALVEGGVSQWDRVIQDIPGGTGYYSGSGAYDCTGCTGPGTFFFSVGADFSARQFTGGNISLSGGITDSTSINPGSFGAAGPAVVDVNPSNFVFGGTTLSLINAPSSYFGGALTAGGAARLDLQYNNDGTVAAGSATGALAEYSPNPPPQ